MLILLIDHLPLFIVGKIGQFRVVVNLVVKARLNAKLVMKISLFARDFHSHANKTSFHLKSFALSLAFVMKLKATRKWPTRSFRFPSFNLSMSRALRITLKMREL